MSGITKLFNKVGNWLSYRFAFLDDPEVKEHAREQAIQDKLDKEMEQAAVEAKQDNDKQSAEVDDKAKKVTILAKKSKFSGVFGNAGLISKIILKIFWYLTPFFIILYAGSITSNWLIGYSAPMRFFAFTILIFVYMKMPLATVIGCILYIIKFIFYNQLYMKEIAPYYSWLPLAEYDGESWKRFVPLFWKSTSLSKLKQAVVKEKYKNAFEINMNTGSIPPKPYEDALATCIEVGRLFGKQGFSRTLAAIKSAEIQLNSIEQRSHGYSHDELKNHVDPIMQATKVSPATGPVATGPVATGPVATGPV